MNIPFDDEAIQAAFLQPACDGSFDPAFAAYLNELGRTRPSIVLAFAPKAAGTYLRSAAIEACGGQLVRTTHALGGRDASFYLPTFLNYYAHGVPARTLVTHVHMQALHANICMIEALDLKPAIMLRPIPDMLASYWDVLDADHRDHENWNNAAVPGNFDRMTREEQGDVLIQMVAPWYVSYFATWFSYGQAAPGRVLMLDYDGFRADPAATLERLMAHSGLPRTREHCQAALDAVWKERSTFRYNKGVSGRGQGRFTAAQLDRLRRMVGHYPDLAVMAERLV